MGGGDRNKLGGGGGGEGGASEWGGVVRVYVQTHKKGLTNPVAVLAKLIAKSFFFVTKTL